MGGALFISGLISGRGLDWRVYGGIGPWPAGACMAFGGGGTLEAGPNGGAVCIGGCGGGP